MEDFKFDETIFVCVVAQPCYRRFDFGVGRTLLSECRSVQKTKSDGCNGDWISAQRMDSVNFVSYHHVLPAEGSLSRSIVNSAMRT